MSFSRWSNSRWYTYWSSSTLSSLSNKRKDQVFEICANGTFSYQELKEDIERCLIIACENEKKVYKNNGFEIDNQDCEFEINESLAPSQEEKDELRGYMIAFMLRVESDTDLED